MSADVMMDLVKDAKVSVNGGQATPQITPLLHSSGTQFRHAVTHSVETL